MAIDMALEIDDQQMADYHENGYLIVRNLLSSEEVETLRDIVKAQAKWNSYPPSLKYPTPGKYTISGNKMAEPGLASIAEHPTVVQAVEAALGQPAHLTAYVAYLRTPGDKGSGAHCDYKRWRPVGSSMNWVFAIIPLVDFDEEYGQFLVSPGSHKLSCVVDENAHIQDLAPIDKSQMAPFIDPELKAGDLLVTSAYTWHEAPAGTTSDDRCGIFNKYCAVNAPPAAGYYPYHSDALGALSEAGKRLIPVCFDEPIATTRLLIERSTGEDAEFLLVRDTKNDRWGLPGGEGWEEEEGVGWDVGSRIGSLQVLVKQQLDSDVPWMSYIEDVKREEGICRVYGFSDDSLTSCVAKNGQADWFTKGQLKSLLGEDDYICQAIATWQRDDIIRGKGKAVSQRKNQFE
jgi:ectoine hydroxylase-related dioxygenase (phytanoyl-CoA dioxygenase family)